jgi:hypothetical protein
MGCGQEDQSADELARRVEGLLSVNGWADRCGVVVIDPELEAWAWGDYARLASQIGWKDQNQSLPEWLVERGYLCAGSLAKPDKPKEAFEAVARLLRVKRSSALYQQLANRLRFEDCADPSFLKLTTLLQTWFGLNLKSP